MDFKAVGTAGKARFHFYDALFLSAYPANHNAASLGWCNKSCLCFTHIDSVFDEIEQNPAVHLHIEIVGPRSGNCPGRRFWRIFYYFHPYTPGNHLQADP